MSEQFDRSFSLVVGCRHCESLGSSSMYLGGQLTVGNIDRWPCSRAQRSTVPRGARPALKSTVQTPDLFKTATVRRVACAVGPAPSFSSMRAHKIQASASCVACACIKPYVRAWWCAIEKCCTLHTGLVHACIRAREPHIYFRLSYHTQQPSSSQQACACIMGHCVYLHLSKQDTSIVLAFY